MSRKGSKFEGEIQITDQMISAGLSVLRESGWLEYDYCSGGPELMRLLLYSALRAQRESIRQRQTAAVADE